MSHALLHFAMPMLAANSLLQTLRWPLTTMYLTLVGLISLYGLHRYWLVHLYRRHRREHVRPPRRFSTLPWVTVQLPMYNEGPVAARVIDAACQLDYPTDRLQIQVLDDSTDDSTELARGCVEHWRRLGIDIDYLHRTERAGYKAGALRDALPAATGEFIAVFDADFLPPPRFLRRTIHHFTDPGVGVVQARWAHLNRDNSLLTRAQAIFLDGHFLIEHTARNRSGAWMNFNGTAGVWRRTAVTDAGGWRSDTLTEDVDLSYRAQLAGWRFVHLPRLTCPAELPPEINAFKSQQHRWSKGSIQVALQLLPTLLRADAPRRVKIEAFFHLTSPMVYCCVTLLALLFYPALFVNLRGVAVGSWAAGAMGVVVLLMGFFSAATFYLTSQIAQHRSLWRTLALVPMLNALGVGIALSNAVACVEALIGHRSPFVRTPKYGSGRPSPAPRGSARSDPPTPKRGISCSCDRRLVLALVELAMGFYMLACAWLSLETWRQWLGLPFLLLFAAGYLYVGLNSLRGQVRLRNRPLATSVHPEHRPTPPVPAYVSP